MGRRNSYNLHKYLFQDIMLNSKCEIMSYYVEQFTFLPRSFATNLLGFRSALSLQKKSRPVSGMAEEKNFAQNKR